MKIFVAVLAAILCAATIGVVVFLVLFGFAAHESDLEAWKSRYRNATRLEKNAHDFYTALQESKYPDPELSSEGWATVRSRKADLIKLLQNKPGDLTSDEKETLAKLRSEPADQPQRTPEPSASSAPITEVPASPSPAATPTPAAFLIDVGYSQKAALAKYPTLGIKGSAFNKRFLAKLEEWKAQDDPRLRSSHWPEMLADECAKP